MQNAALLRPPYQTHARLSPAQQATLESLERHILHHGYQSLTRREKTALVTLRQALQASYEP